MFPERQVGPHREWRNEVEYLDALFDNGAAYTVGKMNGNHWLLYMTTPPEDEDVGAARLEKDEGASEGAAEASSRRPPSIASSNTVPAAFVDQDNTLGCS